MEADAQYSTQQNLSILNQAAQMKGIPYSEAIGPVLWLMVVLRPDTAYAVGNYHNSSKIWDPFTGKE